jgi:hypothetical protein
MIEPVQQPQPPTSPSPQVVVTLTGSFWRNALKWTLAILLVLTCLALFSSLSLMQLTSRGPAERLLRRSVASLTEIDSYVDRRYDDFHRAAMTQAPEPVVLNDFPVRLEFDRTEARAMSRDDLRAALLDRSAALIYDRGMSVFGQGAGEESSTFSTPGAVRRSLDFLRDDNFQVLRVLTFSLGIASAILAFGLTLTGRGFGRLAGVGAAISAAAVPFLVGAVALRYTLRTAAPGQNEFLSNELLNVGAEAAWAAIRNGMAFTVLGLVFLVAGVRLAQWADARAAARRGLSASR